MELENRTIKKERSVQGLREKTTRPFACGEETRMSWTGPDAATPPRYELNGLDCSAGSSSCITLYSAEHH